VAPSFMFEKARWSSFSCWSVSLNCRFAMHKLYDFVSFSQLALIVLQLRLV
jgi:hypothetical protein